MRCAQSNPYNCALHTVAWCIPSEMRFVQNPHWFIQMNRNALLHANKHSITSTSFEFHKMQKMQIQICIIRRLRYKLPVHCGCCMPHRGIIS